MFVGDSEIPAGMRVYAVGDVHGRFDLLGVLLRQIDRETGQVPQTRCKIVMLGDLVDRGPDSNRVLDCLSQRALSPDFICMRGNHDQYILDFLSDPFGVGSHWIRMGGRETLDSYGVTADWEDDPHKVLREFKRLLPRRHLHFLQSTRFSHTIGDYLFAHAGINPDRPLDDQLENDLMWIRHKFLLSKEDFGKVVVHGHTPYDRVDIHPNRINVDTMAFESGILSCLVLEGKQQRVIEASLET